VRHRVRSWLTTAAVVVLFGSAAGSSGAPANASPPAPLSPNPSSTENLLFGVSAVSPTDAWAVGDYIDDVTGHRDTLIVHWNGTAWSQIPSPNPSPGMNELFAVSADSATDAWAVGDFRDLSTDHLIPLILHWDGTAWSQIPSPNPTPGKTTHTLYGVSADSATDAWAVGYFWDKTALTYRTMTFHWDGVAWSREKSPNPGSVANYLNGVSAVSPTNAWAVGREDTVIAGRGYTRALLLHWNGTAWSTVKGPSFKKGAANFLYGVSALSSTDAWASGVKSGVKSAQTLILHWDGTAWKRVPSPTLSGADIRSAALRGVSAESATDAWAVAWGSFTVHWDGSSWSRVSAPNPGTGGYLFGVSTLSPTNAWAVGYYADGSTTYTLILHWDGTAWVMT
jgi:hypothetical protein